MLAHCFTYLIAAFSLTVFLSLNSKAQQENRFKGGIVGGLTTAQIHGDGYAGFNKPGWTLGVFLENKLTDKSTFLIELDYVTKGSFDPPNHQIGKYNWRKIHLGYAEVPVMIKFKLKDFRINLGMAAGFLAREKQSDANSLLTGQDRIIGPFKRYEISYLFGAEYHFSDKWAVAWRNSLSLLPVTNQVHFERTILGFFGGSYNQYMALTLRYKLGN